MPNLFAIDKTLVLGDLRFHYRDWGGRGWPVLLLHGLASTSHIWDLVAPLLVEHARVVALDLRGHGQSDKPDGDYGPASIGGDVRSFLSELSLDNPVIVGHSWGALIGLWLAAQPGSTVGGLIMVDGGIVDFSDLSWDQVVARMTPPSLDGMPVDQFRARMVENAPQGLITPAVETAILANFEIDAEERIHRRLPVEFHMRILRSMWKLQRDLLFDAVTRPVLILAARRRTVDDPGVLARKERGVESALEKLADVEARWLDDTVHDVPLQRPHRLAGEISTFIQERL